MAKQWWLKLSTAQQQKPFTFKAITLDEHKRWSLEEVLIVRKVNKNLNHIVRSEKGKITFLSLVERHIGERISSSLQFSATAVTAVNCNRDFLSCVFRPTAGCCRTWVHSGRRTCAVLHEGVFHDIWYYLTGCSFCFSLHASVPLCFMCNHLIFKGHHLRNPDIFAASHGGVVLQQTLSSQKWDSYISVEVFCGSACMHSA